MALIRTVDTKYRRFQDAKAMFVTRYDEDGNLERETYDIHDIVGDTVSLTQDDAERTEIPWEFGDDPLDENTSLGTKTFTCQCLDFQNVIMRTLFGCQIVNGAVVFPAEYKDLFVMIRIVFDDVDFVLPYVKMDAKPVLENLRSDIARGELTGTLYSKLVYIAPQPFTTATSPVANNVLPAYLGHDSNQAANYQLDTPMVYVPNMGGVRRGIAARAVYVHDIDPNNPPTGNYFDWFTDFHEFDATRSYAITVGVDATGTGNGTVNIAGAGAMTTVNIGYGNSVTIEAVPATGSTFTRWSDGNTEPVRTIIPTADMTLEAVFA